MKHDGRPMYDHVPDITVTDYESDIAENFPVKTRTQCEFCGASEGEHKSNCPIAKKRDMGSMLDECDTKNAKDFQATAKGAKSPSKKGNV